MHRFRLAVGVGLFCGLVSGGAMAACQSNADSLLEDRFSNVDDSWGTFKNYGVENGKLVFKPPAGFNTPAINKSSLYDEQAMPRRAAPQVVAVAAPPLLVATPANELALIAMPPE